MSRRLVGGACLCLAGTLHAQGTRVQGTVIDSTRMRPVVGARVYAIPVATGGRLQALTDADGRYEFPSLPPGNYLLDVRHERRDSLGVDVPLTTLDVQGGAEVRVELGFPSARTIVSARCGAEVEREGGGLILGVVRHARDASPVAQGSVGARWRTFSVDGGRMRRDSAAVVAIADDAGRYLFCGLPPGAGVALQASAASDSSGTIAVVMPDERLVVRDLTVAPRRWREATIANAAGDSAATRVLVGAARLTGRVQDAAGTLVTSARVQVTEAGREAVSTASGEFALDSLPAGTHTVEARAIGFLPASLPVDLPPGGSSQATIVMQRLATALDTVRVRGERVYSGNVLAGVERRQRSGVGWHLGVEQIEKQQAMFPSDLVFAAPGVFLRETGPSQYIAMRGQDGNLCSATIVVDGVRMYGDAMALMEMAPLRRLVAVEVYARPAQIPAELPNAHNGCGLVAFWTGSRESGETNRR